MSRAVSVFFMKYFSLTIFSLCDDPQFLDLQRMTSFVHSADPKEKFRKVFHLAFLVFLFLIFLNFQVTTGGSPRGACELLGWNVNSTFDQVKSASLT